MCNKFKVKKKLVAIALALSLAAQPLCAFPMNVFAGTGKNGVIKAPTVAANFELAKIIELRNGEKFDVNKCVTIIKPQGATVSYNVESQTVFSGSGNLLDTDGQVQNPGIAKVKVTVGGVSKETYVITDINGMLNAASAADAAAYADAYADAAANAAYYAAQSGEFFDAYVGNDAAYSLDRAADLADTSDDEIGDFDAAYSAYSAAEAAASGLENSTSGSAPVPDWTASWVANADTANAWANSYNDSVDGIIDKLKEAYGPNKTPVQKKWLVAAYGMAKVAAHIVAQRLSGKGLDLEARLKVVYACYRVAEAVWTDLGNNQANLDACQAKADALQKVIDSLYSDKVGDIEAQAKAQG